MDVPVVGDQLNIRAEPILSVHPDVLLAQTQANRFESVKQLAPEMRIEPIRIETLGEIGEAMEKVGVALGASETGREAREAFESRLDSVRQLVAGRPCPRVVFVLGHESPAVAGAGTFLQDLIEVAGGANASGERYDGWKRVSVEALLALAPDVVICQTTPDEAEEARDYWEKVLRLQTGSDVRVHVVTDHRWTIPTGALAREPLDQLVKFLHAESDRGEGH